MTEGKKRLLAYREGETNSALGNQEGIIKKDFLNPVRKEK